MYTTSVSLLQRLREGDSETAWKRFVAIYTPLLLHWARRMKLSDDDATDLAQDVFSTLVVQLPKFAYDANKSFRGWLLTVTKHKLAERLRRKRVPTEESPEDIDFATLDGDPAMLIGESEFREYVVRRCVQLISEGFAPTSWRAFWLLVVEKKTAPEAARETGLSVTAVYSAKVRVLERLREELAGLIDDV